ncbi:Alanine-tRNA ligase, class IIc [Artemisia annua]|uniref:Alanine-tRNA ligase, class IIc n=1 Tax=Artemisia annua TaxID=35608 RepID=A0A2U1L5W0_ARTAN|nr:Alanine-tRNA ligase, class IIc [Artemisia annua]
MKVQLTRNLASSLSSFTSITSFFRRNTLSLSRFRFSTVVDSLREGKSMGSQVEEIEWPANKVRDTFIKFFEDRNHVYWKSSPVVPVNDPTLLFANAGPLLFVL